MVPFSPRAVGGSQPPGEEGTKGGGQLTTRPTRPGHGGGWIPGQGK